MSSKTNTKQPDQSVPVVGVLLAGGQSRRMGGGDKCLLKLGQKTLLEMAIDRLSPQVSNVVLNANGDPERFANYRLPVVPDSVEGFAGPLAGVLSGLIWTRQNHRETRWIVTAATDTPFFPENLVTKFLDVADNSYPVIVLASSQGKLHPVFGLWPTALAEHLNESLRKGVRKVLAWTDQHDTRTADFPFMEIGKDLVDPFFNTNNPEELSRAETIIEQALT